MFDKLKKILDGAQMDYGDIRYEVKKTTEISFSGRELNQAGSNTTDGYVLRILKNGGMSSVVFNKEEDASKAMLSAVENAELIALNIDKSVKLAETAQVRDTFLPPLNEDPRKISMEEKLELVRKHNDIPLGHDRIVNTQISYRDVTRDKYFYSTEGAEIHEELVTTVLSGTITAGEGSLLQNVRVSAGGSSGFNSVRNQEENFAKRTAMALDLLKAEPVKGGNYACVLNPSLTGVFAHEAFGHFSEADIVEDLPAMREKMKIGNKLGSDILNIVDDATITDQLGFFKYDDEGVEVRPVELMKNGVLAGRLHSRRTSAEFGEPLSGHCVAEDFRYAPIVRMGTIFVKPGESSFNDLLNMMDDGLYILDAKGGQTAGENFTFGAHCGYMVKGGKLGRMVRDINIQGNLYKTLNDISGIGDDFALSKVGGCGKGQMNIRSCYGGPHILVNNLVVGGV